jgi:hypothetical protein
MNNWGTGLERLIGELKRTILETGLALVTANEARGLRGCWFVATANLIINLRHGA